MSEVHTQPERDALEAVRIAIDEARGKVYRLFGGYDYSSYGRTPPLVVRDERQRQSRIIWEGDDREEFERQYRKATGDYIAQAAIHAYLSTLSERGMRVMPREATDEMICAGIAERHGEPVPEAWSLATKNVWAAMFDAFDPNHNKSPQSDGGKG